MEWSGPERREGHASKPEPIGGRDGDREGPSAAADGSPFSGSAGDRGKRRSKQALTVAIVEDRHDDYLLLLYHLREGGLDIAEAIRVETAAEFRAVLSSDIDLIIADYYLPGFGAIQALEIFNRSGLDLPFIVVSGVAGEETAVETMRRGAHDYIMKDRLSRLVPAVERELAEVEVRSQRRLAIEKLRFRALHDDLTGLANRKLFTHFLDQAVARYGRRRQGCFAVLFLDLDGFKVINDTHGHLVGDQFLLTIASRLEASLRPGDVIARFGGDEFTILLDDVQDPNDIPELVQGLQEAVAQPVDIGGKQFFTTASIGITLSAPRYERSDEVLRDADMAMYRAKQAGKARAVIFDVEMHRQAFAHLELRNDLRRAIAEGQFVLHFQPIVDLTDGSLEKVESLVRWEHPTAGLLRPESFVPAAESSGLIYPLGRWVLESSCRQLAEWSARLDGGWSPRLSVNVSARQFHHEQFLADLESMVESYSISPGMLRLEITEGIMVESSDRSSKVMRAVKDLGVGLDVDDFGTGYSSLAYLHEFPVDALKIDRSFVGRIEENADGAAVIPQAIVQLARTLKIDVIAEGVETKFQLETLRRIRCRFGQGFFLGRPAPEEELAELLSSGRSDEWSRPGVHRSRDEGLRNLDRDPSRGGRRPRTNRRRASGSVG